MFTSKIDTIFEVDKKIIRLRNHSEETGRNLKVFMFFLGIMLILFYIRAFFWHNSSFINLLKSLGIDAQMFNIG